MTSWTSIISSFRHPASRRPAAPHSGATSSCAVSTDLNSRLADRRTRTDQDIRPAGSEPSVAWEAGARDLPERAPRPPSRSPTTCYAMPRLSWGDTLRRRAANGRASVPRPLDVEEVRSSILLAPTKPKMTSGNIIASEARFGRRITDGHLFNWATFRCMDCPAGLPPLLGSFERHLRAASRADTTVATYLIAARQAEAFLHARGTGLPEASRADLRRSWATCSPAARRSWATCSPAAPPAPRRPTTRSCASWYAWLEEVGEVQASIRPSRGCEIGWFAWRGRGKPDQVG
jgi:hypothetical protein